MSLNDNALGTLKKAYAWLREKQVAQPAAETPSSANPPIAAAPAPAPAPASVRAAAGVQSAHVQAEAHGVAARKSGEAAARDSIVQKTSVVQSNVASAEPAEGINRGPSVEELRLTWADASALNIETSSAVRIGRTVPGPDQFAVDQGGEQAIIGLDFGTAFTKAIVRFRARDYVVDWSRIVKVEHPYLLPTGFSENSDGVVALGNVRLPGWTSRHGLKLPLVEAESLADLSETAFQDAALFVAAAIREIQRWFRLSVPGSAEVPVRWRVHMGLPSRTVDGEGARIFAAVGASALEISARRVRLSRTEVGASRPQTHSRLTVIPELRAQIQAYLASPQRQPDAHYLLDFGAGTLDAAVFICHRASGQDVISIIASDVSRLGTHYLLASLVGSAGQKLSWRDGDADRTPGSIAATTGEAEQQIQARLASYKSLVRRRAYQAFVDARRVYQTGEVMLGRRPFPVLLCGGGARLRETRANINLLSREFTNIGRPPLDISELPRPARDELIAPMGFDYDRLAVAHGLCELSRNLGTVQGMKGVEPVLAGERTQVDDRDATR